MLVDDAQRAGTAEVPFHLLVPSKEHAHTRKDVVRHVWSRRLPPRALIRMYPHILVVGPELLFCELAARADFDELDLALIGFELCGTYLIDERMDEGFHTFDDPMTSSRKIARFIERMGSFRGIRKARAALRLVHDGSHSPMETVMCLLLAGPRRIGSMGFGPVALNHEVDTSDGPRRIDAAFLGYNVGLEYKGRAYHGPDRTKRDDRRQNKLVGCGFTILNVWYEDLVSDVLFDQLVTDVAHALGVRVRIRSRAHAADQRILRMRLLPYVTSCGAVG